MMPGFVTFDRVLQVMAAVCLVSFPVSAQKSSNHNVSLLPVRGKRPCRRS
jgi:hypothetical protein